MNKMTKHGGCFDKVKEFKTLEIVAVIIDEIWYFIIYIITKLFYLQ